MLQEINKEILINLNSLTNYEFIQSYILYVADTPIFFLPIFLISMWFFYSYKKNTDKVSEINLKKEILLYIFYSIILGIIISLIIQQIIHVNRPEESLEGVGKLLLKHIPDASFPSDHATVAIAFLSSLFLAGFKKIGLLYTPFVVIMLLSRIVLGVHWPLDIIVGSLVGLFSSYIIFKYISQIKFIIKINQFIIKIMSYIKL